MTVAALPQPRALSAPASPVAEFARRGAAAGPPSELDCRARVLAPLGQHAGQVGFPDGQVPSQRFTWGKCTEECSWE